MTAHKASLATGAIQATFTPTQNFEGYDPDDNLLGSYKKGKTYFVRKGNTMLMQLAEGWQQKGLVVIN